MRENKSLSVVIDGLGITIKRCPSGLGEVMNLSWILILVYKCVCVEYPQYFLEGKLSNFLCNKFKIKILTFTFISLSLCREDRIQEQNSIQKIREGTHHKGGLLLCPLTFLCLCPYDVFPYIPLPNSGLAPPTWQSLEMKKLKMQGLTYPCEYMFNFMFQNISPTPWFIGNTENQGNRLCVHIPSLPHPHTLCVVRVLLNWTY